MSQNKKKSKKIADQQAEGKLPSYVLVGIRKQKAETQEVPFNTGLPSSSELKSSVADLSERETEYNYSPTTKKGVVMQKEHGEMLERKLGNPQVKQTPSPQHRRDTVLKSGDNSSLDLASNMLPIDPQANFSQTMPAHLPKESNKKKELYPEEVWEELCALMQQDDLRIERHVWDSQEQFLAAYQRHMTTIYKELERHKRLAQEQEFNMRQNALVQQLTKDMNFFKEMSFKLSTDSEAFMKDITRLEAKLKETQEEKIILVSATRRSQLIHKQLKIALEQSNDQVKKLSDSYQQLLNQQKQETFYRNIEDVENTFVTTADLSQLGEVQRIAVQSLNGKDGIDVAQAILDIFESNDWQKQQVRRVLDEATKLISTKLQLKFDSLKKDNRLLNTKVKNIKDIQPYQREMDAMFVKCVRSVKSEVSRRKAQQSNLSHQSQACSKFQNKRDSPSKSNLKNTAANIQIEDRVNIDLQKVLNKDFTFNQKIKEPKLNQSSECELRDVPEIMDDLDNKEVLQHQDRIKILDLFIKDTRVEDVLMEIYFHPEKNILKKESMKENISCYPQLNSLPSNIDDTTVPFYKSEMNITMEEVCINSDLDLPSSSGQANHETADVETLRADSAIGSKCSANLIHSIRPNSYNTNWCYKKRNTFGQNPQLLSKRRNTANTTTCHEQMDKANIRVGDRRHNVTIISPRSGTLELSAGRQESETDALDRRFQNYTTFQGAIDSYKRPTTGDVKRQISAMRQKRDQCTKLNVMGKTKLPIPISSNFFLS